MFEPHFALRENPFVAGHQSRFIYPSPEHQEALAHLRYGIENREPFVLITGEVGTGKTTALFEVLNEWKSRAVVAVVTNSALSRNELLEEIALRLGFSVPGTLSKPQILSHLERHLLALHAKGERAILLLDEAQNLDRELLEEIRLLSNLEAQGEKLLQVFLLGQPELDAKLSQPELRQLRQRVAVHYRLKPLHADDTERYIHHRVAVAGGYGPKILPSDTCAEVFALTHGIPREINQLCAQALLNAFVEDAPVVRPEHVRAAAREIEFESVLTAHPTRGADPHPQITRTTPMRDTHPPEPAASAPSPSSTAMTAPPPDPTPAAAPVAVESISRSPLPAEHTEGLPLDDASEHAPVGPVIPATDEANWEAWVRSLMTSRPATEEPADRTPPAQPSSVPDPLPVPEPAPQPARVPEPTISPVPDPDRSPEPPPSPARPEPPPDPTRARDVRPEPQPILARIDPLPGRDLERPIVHKLRDEFEAPGDTAIPARAAPLESWRPRMWTPERDSGGRRPSYASRFEEETEDDEAPRRHPASRWMVTIAILVALAIGALLMFRFGTFSRPAPQATATAPTDTSAATAEAQTPAAEPAPPASEPAPPAQETRATPSDVDGPTIPGPTISRVTPPIRTVRPQPVAPAPANTWSLVVGTFLDESRARGESERLGTSTGMPARVRTVTESGSRMYQVAIGTFSDRGAAERAAGDLVGKGLVSEARVVARRKAAAAPAPAPTPTP